MTNVNQAPLPRLSKAPLVRASLVKRRYIKYPALPFLPFTSKSSNKEQTTLMKYGMNGRNEIHHHQQCEDFCNMQEIKNTEILIYLVTVTARSDSSFASTTTTHSHQPSRQLCI